MSKKSQVSWKSALNCLKKIGNFIINQLWAPYKNWIKRALVNFFAGVVIFFTVLQIFTAGASTIFSLIDSSRTTDLPVPSRTQDLYYQPTEAFIERQKKYHQLTAERDSLLEVLAALGKYKSQDEANISRMQSLEEKIVEKNLKIENLEKELSYIRQVQIAQGLSVEYTYPGILTRFCTEDTSAQDKFDKKVTHHILVAFSLNQELFTEDSIHFTFQGIKKKVSDWRGKNTVEYHDLNFGHGKFLLPNTKCPCAIDVNPKEHPYIYLYSFKRDGIKKIEERQFVVKILQTNSLFGIKARPIGEKFFDVRGLLQN